MVEESKPTMPEDPISAFDPDSQWDWDTIEMGRLIAPADHAIHGMRPDDAFALSAGMCIAVCDADVSDYEEAVDVARKFLCPGVAL